MPRHANDPQSDAERAGEEFDQILRASEQRAEEKRETRTYPYDLEEGE
ncbi:hypothetical protein [Streptomyces canus]|nr:hypothetical protein OH824_34845 [Streptomyces canus]